MLRAKTARPSIVNNAAESRTLLSIPEPMHPVSSRLTVLDANGLPDAVTQRRIDSACGGPRFLSKEHLTDAALRLVDDTFNPRTLNTLQSEWRAWIEFCSIISAPFFLTGDLRSRESQAIPFVAWLIETGTTNTWGSLEKYISGVRSFHRAHGLDQDCIPRKRLPALDAVILAARRFLNAQSKPDPKSLLPPQTFAELLASWDINNPAQSCVAAAHRAISVTCRRAGDVLPARSGDFSPDRNLCLRDIHLGRDFITIILRTTKNRPQGPAWVGVLIPNTSDPSCCAFAAVHRYADTLLKKSSNLDPLAPFFQRFDADLQRFPGAALTTSDLDRAINQQALKLTGEKGTCYLRMEGANLMIAAGLPPAHQERYADWSQNSIRCGYKRIMDPMFFCIQAALNETLANFRWHYHLKDSQPSPSQPQSP